MSIDYIFPQTIEQNTQRINQSSCDEENLTRLDESTHTTSCFQPITDFFLWSTYPIQFILYYLFCCFLCTKHTKNQDYTDLSVVDKIKKNLKQLKKKKINDDLRTIYALVQLLKKDENAIRYLKKIRINPKLNRISSKKQGTKLRSDLEFFLPQIVSHYLRDDLDREEEAAIVDFIMKGCEQNIFFAHRVWFNLKASLINKDNQTQVMKILSLLSELEVLVLKSQEKLYIANSDALVKLITKTNLDNMLSPECLLM